MVFIRFVDLDELRLVSFKMLKLDENVEFGLKNCIFLWFSRFVDLDEV